MSTNKIKNRLDFLTAELKRLQIVIFDSTYQCQMMQRDIYDLDYINTLGMPVSSIHTVNEIMDSQWSYRLLTINEMVEYIAQGVSFKLEEPGTYAKVVYDSLTNYIKYYAEVSERYPNLQIPDADDFIKMDDAAAKVYEVYRCFEPAGDLGSIMGRIRARRSRFSNVRDLSKEPAQMLDKEGNVIVKQHETALSSFSYRISRRKEPTKNE